MNLLSPSITESSFIIKYQVKICDLLRFFFFGLCWCLWFVQMTRFKTHVKLVINFVHELIQAGGNVLWILGVRLWESCRGNRKRWESEQLQGFYDVRDIGTLHQVMEKDQTRADCRSKRRRSAGGQDQSINKDHRGVLLSKEPRSNQRNKDRHEFSLNTTDRSL